MKYNPWEDKQCINEYCNKYADDFDYFIAENYPSDYRTSNYEKFELSYCEANEHDFLDFALEFENELEYAEADKRNDTLEDK